MRTFGFLIHSVLTKEILEASIRQRTCGAKTGKVSRARSRLPPSAARTEGGAAAITAV